MLPGNRSRAAQARRVRSSRRRHYLMRGRVLWLLAVPGRTEGLKWLDMAGINHGILSGGVAFQGTTRRGGYGQVSFSTSTSAVTVTSVPRLQLTADWTYAAWLRTSGTPGTNNVYTLFSHWTNTSSGRQIFIYLDGNHSSKVQVDIPFIKAVVTGNTSLNDGAWHRVAVTRAGTTWTIYVDGAQDATATDATAQEACGTSLELGYSTPSSSLTKSFNGPLDDFAIASRAWTAAEVKKDFAVGKVRYPGMLNHAGERGWVTSASRPARCYGDDGAMTGWYET